MALICSGLKGKQRVRAYDVYGWNMNLITNETELLRQCHADCAAILEQVSALNGGVGISSIAEGLDPIVGP